MKNIPKAISNHFAKLAKKSWEVRRQRILDADLTMKEKKIMKLRKKTTIQNMQEKSEAK